MNNKDTLEIIYTWPDGREEIRYRRPYPSTEAQSLMDEVDDLRTKAEEFYGETSPYSYRFV